MAEVEKIKANGTLLGIKVSGLVSGTTPITDEAAPLQLLTLKHPKGRTVAAHRHVPHERRTEGLAECLIVKSGTIRVDVYDTEGMKQAECVLNAGEAYISLDGGVGVEYLTDAEVFELKNGPFIQDEKKFL